MSEAVRRLAALLAPVLLIAAAPPGPNLGRPIAERDVAAIDLTIMPDGRGLPSGRGDVARGAAVYAAQCVACHGPRGAGGAGLQRLTGGVGSLSGAQPVKTVASFWPHAPLVFDYIRRAMPITAPQSLPADDAYAVTAYLLSIDGIVAPDAVLDARRLAAVRMPNRDGFVPQALPPARP